MITEICRKYCDLTDDDIEEVVRMSKSMEVVSDFYESDVFIDVPSKNNDIAIVVKHIKPVRKQSLYKDNVVGKQAVKDNEPGVFNSLERGIAIDDMKALTQENKIVKQKIRPIIRAGKVIGVIIVEIDISDEIKNDIKLDNINKGSEIRTSKFGTLLKNNKAITNNFEDAILIFDNNGLLSVSNDNANKIYKSLGYNYEMKNVAYNDLTLTENKFEDIIKHQSDDKIIKEIHINSRYFKITTTIIEGQDVKLLVVIKDITEIKKKEIEIEIKNIAIKESNHRIKNNLQTVAAILRRQRKDCTGEEEKLYLQQCINRILTIATTHDFLSKANNDNIEIGSAIRILINNIKDSSNTGNIACHIESNEIYMSGHKVTALLLVINELVQNCYDHAFEGLDSGEINIKIKEKNNNITINIVDNGIGFGNIETKIDSLGLSIVKNYINQVLKGSIIIDSNDRGSNVKIVFQNN